MSSPTVRILLLEFDEQRGNLIETVVCPEPNSQYTIDRVDSLSQGLLKIGSGEYGLVLTRLDLPDANGLDALVKVHLADSGLPVIALLKGDEEGAIYEAVRSLSEDCMDWAAVTQGSLRQSIVYAFERREMLSELKSRHEQLAPASSGDPFRALFDSIDWALFLISPETGDLLYANSVANKWFGADIEASLSDLIDERLMKRSEYRSEVKLDHPAIRNAELRLVRLDWREKPTLMITLRSISKRKRAEKAFISSKRRLDLALKTSNIGLWSYDIEFGKFMFSDKLKAQLGLDGHEFPNRIRAVRQRLHPEDRAQTFKKFKNYIRDPYSDFECEYRLRHKDGEYRYIICRADLVKDKHGKRLRLVGSHIDITERRNQEEAKQLFENHLLETQKIESIGTMAGGMAHNLNNMLTSIMGNASLIKEESQLSSMSMVCIQNLEKSALKAAQLCQKMLSFSGKGNFKVQEVDVTRTVLDTLGLIEISMPRTATIDLNLSDTLPSIKADPAEIEQMLLSIAINGAEALPRDEQGTLKLTTGSREMSHADLVSLSHRLNAQPGEFVFLEIEDNGHGMRADVAARVFEPFFTTNLKGRGLGLAAVQGIAAAHSGAIDLKSELGQGTTFGVYLPSEAQKEVVVSAPKVSREKQEYSKLVLLADDEDVLRMVIESMLKLFGYEVVNASDGCEAIEMYEKYHDELAFAIIDQNMPNVRGDEVYRAIRERSHEFPVLIMSGDGDNSECLEIADEKSVPCQFLHKPFGLDQLKRSVALLLDRSASLTLDLAL